MHMKNLFVILLSIIFLSACIVGQALAQQDNSPSAVVRFFYRNLHEKNYVTGLRLSVYNPAVEKLTAEEVKDLEPEFSRIAEGIPAEVEIRGEQVSGDEATVFVKLPGSDKPQEMSLIKVDGQWRVGDKDTFKLVKKEGRDFFFNARIQVGEAEAYQWMEEISGAQIIYFQAKKKFTSLEELIALGGVSKQITENAGSSYKFELKLSDDGLKYAVSAIPTQYGRTGRKSYFVDHSGIIRAEDKKGQPASASAPEYKTER
jgi:hypothetical protein